MGSSVFHYTVGQLGHAFVILAFVLGLGGSLAFLLASRAKKTDSELVKLGNFFGWGQGIATWGIACTLFWIIYHHYFEYGYAWSHSSLHLDPKYMIACFWEGQEGSFLLWACWNALLWFVILSFRGSFPPIASAILLAVQAVLASMLLGVDLLGLKIGSSPFILLREQMAGTAPIFSLNPEFIPKDGRGLNPLLQNYWNIIHPPTLFLGFALTGIPYALSMAQTFGQEVKKTTLRTWLLVAVAVLGVGIMMGAYWAYETLNFGGYWNWDPVENAVYIPWLVLVAALHTLLLPTQKAGNALLMHGLVQLAFILVLYSTFLTRSGILGETSVHSFTDLGLSGQLLLFLGVFASLSIWTLWRQPSQGKKPVTSPSLLEWLLVSGITLLVLASFQVLVSTSIPVFNEVAKAFGATRRWAPPAEPIKHYTAWQMGFAVLILALSALAQVVYRMTIKGLKLTTWQYLGMGVLLLGGYISLTFGLKHWQDYTLFLIAVAALGANGYLLVRKYQEGLRRNAGTLSHFGLAIMLIGILFSAGYSKVVSVNRSGRIYNKSFSTEMTRDNVLLWRGKPQQMDGYEVFYEGPQTELAKPYALVDSDSLLKLEDGYRALVLGHLEFQGKIYGHRGDTVDIRPENTYFKVICRDSAAKKSFTLYPRAQANPAMGLLASPDIYVTAGFDLYTHISSIPNSEDKEEPSELQTVDVMPNKIFFANDFVCKLTRVKTITKLPEVPNATFDAGVEVVIEVQGPEKTYQARPRFVIKGNEVGRLYSDIKALGLRFEVLSIDPTKGIFQIGYHTTQQDWIILKAVEKPFIGLVWGGFLVMVAGFGLALTNSQSAKGKPNKYQFKARKKQTKHV